MAQLPNADRALVDRAKIVDYLLASTHKDGSAKSRFLADFGVRLDAPDVLLATLTLHAQSNEV